MARSRSAAHFTYRVYGVTVRSSVRLPCRLDRSGAPPDVRLSSAPSSRFRSARTLAPPQKGPHAWFRCLRLQDGTTYLRWSELFEFLVSPDGREILFCRHRKATLESLRVYLLGQVLSFSLLAMGIESLHGTVIVMDEGAVALVGDCGYGKSTLGAAMLAKGFPVLTDDVIAVRDVGDGWWVEPGAPRIKLFPSIARRVLPGKRPSTPMNNRTAKLVLPLAGSEVVGRPTRLKAIYVLAAPRRHARGLRPRVRSLTGRRAFLEVVRAAFNLLVVREDRLAGQFRFANDLAARVPVRRLTYPRSLSQLPAVCNAVVKDLARLPAQGTATAQ